MKLSKKTHAFRIVSVTTVIAMMLALVVVMSSCNLKSIIPAKDTTNDTTSNDKAVNAVVTTMGAVTTAEPAPPPPTYYSLLTGLPYEIDVSKIRPISLCIGNTASSLPQEGIEHADILVEALVEGGITRLMMIVGDPSVIETVGSVRSTRDYLAMLSDDFGAIAVYAGTSDSGKSEAIGDMDVIDALTTSDVDYFFRDETRKLNLGYEHSLMTNRDAISSAIASKKYASKVSDNFTLPYKILTEGSVSVNGASASYLKIPFSSTQTVEFKYVDSTKEYQRYQNGALHKSTSGETLSFKNLLVLFSYATTTETATVAQIDFDMESGGEGYYFTNGKYTAATWSRDKAGNLTVADTNGNLLNVNAGKSYIAIVKSSMKGSLSFSSNSQK